MQRYLEPRITSAQKPDKFKTSEYITQNPKKRQEREKKNDGVMQASPE
jgi:hypothetical protein